MHFRRRFSFLPSGHKTIRASESAAAWLFGVAQRTALAARRKRERRREEGIGNGPACWRGITACDRQTRNAVCLNARDRIAAEPVPDASRDALFGRPIAASDSGSKPIRRSDKSRGGWFAGEGCCGRDFCGGACRCRSRPARLPVPRHLRKRRSRRRWFDSTAETCLKVKIPAPQAIVARCAGALFEKE